MLPRTIWVDDLDANARNWPHKIKMKRGLDYPKAIWGQEFFEARLKLLLILLATTLILATVYWLPSAAFGAAVYVFMFTGRFNRWLEIVGHEIEVQAASMFYGVDETVYRRNEARALLSYPQFKGHERKDLESRMEKRTKFAVQFVNHYHKKIEKNGKE